MPDEDHHKREDLDFEGTVACSSDEFDVALDVEPKKINVPAVVKFTITNRMEFPYRFGPDNNPVVFTEGTDGWEKFPLAERLRFSEDETVDKSYSFEKEIPYSNWNPEPGNYLLLIYGRVLEEEATHKVNVTDEIEVV
jgi:hypothetical protein